MGHCEIIGIMTLTITRSVTLHRYFNHGRHRSFNPVTVQFSLQVALIGLALTTLLMAKPALPYKIVSTGDALEYLSRFGYIHNLDEDQNIKLEEAREGVREFQEFANLIPNGKLNKRTILAMNKKRCGNKDLRVDESDEVGFDLDDSSSTELTETELQRRSNPDVLVRRKRYDLQGPKWRKRILTYKIAKFASSSLKPKTLQKEIDLAFKYWEREANITFKKVWDGKADIEISFFTGDHGDEESFDGPSKTLAHAFYPTKGRIHFDDEEKWTANTRHGHNLRTVAVHEIGHALGLGHTTEKRAVMYLLYQGFKDKLQLHNDDVAAIQRLYGPKIDPSHSTRISSEIGNPSPSGLKLDGLFSLSDTSKENLPDLCIDPSFDAISTLADGHIYIFKGDYYFRMKFGQPYSREQYPRRINETFPGLPSSLDTVLTIKNGKTYFFKGRLYWRSTGTRMDKGYPKSISTNFLGVPNHLDGSTVWSWNNMVYFFKKNRYWRYSFEHPRRLVEKGIVSKQRIKKGVIKIVRKNASGYPRKIAPNWPGIPDEINDAFLAPNNRTYFFKKGEYWQFHDPDSDQEAASYPRPSSSWWFGCPESNGENSNNNNYRRHRHSKHKKVHSI